jgi:NADH-quinone oxidoreductase subunit I
MFGIGIAKGLAVTLKHFVDTYVDDLKYFPRRYSAAALESRQSVQGRGIFTVQYPEQERPVPEAFRFIPFLVYDIVGTSGEKAVRCTACGICAKVCPPQCIWITRGQDSAGKPLSKPVDFCIDIDVCMNCGFCAEFCPFNSIVMGHDYKLADYERHDGHIYNLQRLLHPAGHYARIRPNQYAARQAAKKKEPRATKEE